MLCSCRQEAPKTVVELLENISELIQHVTVAAIAYPWSCTGNLSTATLFCFRRLESKSFACSEAFMIVNRVLPCN